MHASVADPSAEAFDPRLLRIDPRDNVLCVARSLAAGDTVRIGDRRIILHGALPHGYKLAADAIPAGAPVVKYGHPIGTATCAIAVGELVHVHNVRSDYLPTYLHETQTTYFGEAQPRENVPSARGGGGGPAIGPTA